MTESREPSLEQRLRKVEDTLAIYRLIASHPPAADTGTGAYYRNAFAADGTIDLGGGKGATGNDAIAAIVSTPAHQAAIAGGLCHFAGLPYVEVNGDTAVAVSYLQIISPDRDSVQRVVRPWRLDGIPDSSRRCECVGISPDEGRLESHPAQAAAAGRLAGSPRSLAHHVRNAERRAAKARLRASCARRDCIAAGA
jgi:hypothetical protein